MIKNGQILFRIKILQNSVFIKIKKKIDSDLKFLKFYYDQNLPKLGYDKIKKFSFNQNLTNLDFDQKYINF